MAIKRRWILLGAGLSLALLLGRGWQLAQPPVKQETAWLQQLYTDHAFQAKGGPVIVNFWASWCAPCRRELPILNELYRQGVPIIGFSLDEDPFLAQEFLMTYPTDFEHILDHLPKADTIRVYPTTLIMDRNGIPVFIHEGEISRAELDTAWRALNTGKATL
jgi:thiol-disulfide isomerase/thioredoxin